MGLPERIVDAYVYVDRGIMRGVNMGVHAWNWTTGETKSQLANKLLTLAPIAETVGFSLPRRAEDDTLSYLVSGLFWLPFGILVSHSTQRTNEKIEMCEEKAADSCLKDIYAEGMKELYKFLGALWGSDSFFQASLGTRADYHSHSNLIAVGAAMRGASFYIMRADYLPPKKNCLRRGADKLKEIVESYKPQPTLGLAPAQLSRENM